MQLSQWVQGKTAKLMWMTKIKHELKYSTELGPLSGMINAKNMEKQGDSTWIKDIRK